MGLLECKGTRSRGHAVKQLASGVEQLAGVVVNSQALPGLVVSSVVSDHEITYFAVSTDGGLSESDVMDKYANLSVEFDPIRVEDPDFLDVQIPSFSSADEALLGQPDSQEATLASAALAESWASIADLSGNDDGVRRWTPSDASDRGAPRRREREEWITPSRRVRGISNTVTLPGGRLEAVLGVLDFVDEAISSGDSLQISEAQGRAAAMERSVEVVDDVVTAYGSDGTALLLRPT